MQRKVSEIAYIACYKSANLYWVKTPRLVQHLFPSLTWRKKTSKKQVYLSFDDGPIPEITPWILDQLDEYQAKATFFCVGHNVDKHQSIFDSIVDKGHAVGNHTYHHKSAWSINVKNYQLDISKAAKKINSKLFRPPYGNLPPISWKRIKKDYDIIMWDVLSGDFDPSISPQKCIDNVLTNISPGSIIVLHDNVKSIPVLRIALPKILAGIHKLGYEMLALDQDQKTVSYDNNI